MSQRNYPAFNYSLPPIVIGVDWSWSGVYYPDGVDADPFDWTGWTATMKVRAKASDAAALVTVTVALSSDGTIALSLAHTATANVAPHDQAAWDIVTTAPGGATDRFAAGHVPILQRVSR